jgi:hypothetical protein
MSVSEDVFFCKDHDVSKSCQITALEVWILDLTGKVSSIIKRNTPITRINFQFSRISDGQNAIAAPD